MVQPLEDPTILQWIETALRERHCDSYVHWEPVAQEGLARDAGVPTERMDEMIAEAFANGVKPKIETQRDEKHWAQDRYFWVLAVKNVKIYVKVDAYADHLGEPRLDVVSCHKSLS